MTGTAACPGRSLHRGTQQEERPGRIAVPVQKTSLAVCRMPHYSPGIMKSLLPLFLLAFTSPLVVAGDEPAPGGANVSVSLVSDQDGVAAAKPFTVALRMEHKPHWHTYWLNPGIGQETSVKWNLPDGFTAGPVLWPVPRVKETAIGNQHVYEGTVLLLTEITPPATLAAGSAITIAGTVDWLCCDEGDSCLPGQKDVTLSLSAKEPVVNAAVKRAFDAVRSQQPQPSAAWKVEVADGGTETVFTLTPGDGANPKPGAIYFFDTAKVIETEPQKARAKNGKFILTLKKREQTTEEAALPLPAGFLHASKGWLKKGPHPALAVTVGKSQPVR